MNKSIIVKCMIGLGVLSVASCSDPMDEITSIIFDREFSPVDLESSNIKETTAQLKWAASERIKEYVVEVYADDSLTFAKAPSIVKNVSSNKISLEGLTYDTQYSVKVVACDPDGKTNRNSNPATVYFKTAAQQIFDVVEEDNIGDRSVVLTWPKGETEISEIRAYESATMNAASTHVISDAELAAGRAIVTGLNPETKYTFKLYFVQNGVAKERGSKTLTTIADLNGATLVRPTDDIATMISEAKDGDVFALTGGTFVVNSESEGVAGCITVSKNITIKGIYPTRVPTINGRFQLDDGATLTINQVNLDGENTTGDQCFNFKGTNVGGVSVDNSEIKNYSKGVYYVNVEARVPYIKFNNCLIHNITCEGGDMFDCRKGCIDLFSMTNSTVYASCAARDFVRFDDASASFAGATPVVTIDHCTIDAAANASGKRLLYVRFAGTTINWTNNVTTNTTAVWSNQSKTTVPTFGNNNVYFNCAKLNVLDGADAGKTNLFIDEKASTLDPQYTDAANGNFKYKNESVSKLKAGDPRWCE